MNRTEECIEYVWQHLVSKRTYLIYDYKNAVKHDQLPSREEILKNYPNAGGFSTGMEDGCINAGTLICALLRQNKGEYAEKTMRALIKGILSVKDEGFIPRNFCEQDGVTHYSLSSRDQFTMCLFGFFKYLNSPFCTEEDRENIAKIAVLVAKRAEKNITGKTGFNLLCENGISSDLTTMWGDTLKAHEFYRLPMIYIFAYYTTKDSRWYDMYKKYRAEAYEKSSDLKDAGRLYTYQQMQASLYVCKNAETDEAWKEKTDILMKRVSDFVEGYAPRVEKELDQYSDYNDPQPCFRNCRLFEREDIKALNLPCLVPERISKYGSMWAVQDAANLIICQALGGREPSERSVKVLEKAFDKIDFDKYEDVTAVHLAAAFGFIE